MAGLLSTGQGYRRNALSGLSRAAELEGQRERTKDQLDAADDAQVKSNTAMGAGIGYMAGASMAGGGAAAGAEAGSMAGPVGAVVGAVLGFAFSKLF